MFTVNLNITAAPELLSAVNGLAAALQGKANVAPPASLQKVENGSADTAKTVVAIATTATTGPEKITIEQLRVATSEKAAEKKQDGIRKTLEGFGVTKITELKEDQYADYLAKLKEL